MDITLIESKELQSLLNKFYVYQQVLTSTPVGESNLNGTFNFPNYREMYTTEFDNIVKELTAHGIIIIKNVLPEDVGNSYDETGFLNEFKRQTAFIFLAIMNGKTINPPKELDYMITNCVESLDRPWN